MTIDDILEMMDDLIDKSVTVPFSNKKCMIDSEKLREYIDNIRYNLPTEIKRARELEEDRSDILSDASSKAEEIIKQAEERAKVLVSQDEIVKQAKEAADDLTAQAKAMDLSIRNAMTDKLSAILSEAEKALTKSLKEIKAMHDAVKAAADGKKQ